MAPRWEKRHSTAVKEGLKKTLDRPKEKKAGETSWQSSSRATRRVDVDCQKGKKGIYEVREKRNGTFQGDRKFP